MTGKRLAWIANLFCIKKTVVFYDSRLCSGTGYPNKENHDHSVKKHSLKFTEQNALFT